eukprot:768533-Hanusia_phi.AAC.5
MEETFNASGTGGWSDATLLSAWEELRRIVSENCHPPQQRDKALKLIEAVMSEERRRNASNADRGIQKAFGGVNGSNPFGLDSVLSKDNREWGGKNVLGVWGDASSQNQILNSSLLNKWGGSVNEHEWQFGLGNIALDGDDAADIKRLNIDSGPSDFVRWNSGSGGTLDLGERPMNSEFSPSFLHAATGNQLEIPFPQVQQQVIPSSISVPEQQTTSLMMQGVGENQKNGQSGIHFMFNQQINPVQLHLQQQLQSNAASTAGSNNVGGISLAQANVTTLQQENDELQKVSNSQGKFPTNSVGPPINSRNQSNSTGENGTKRSIDVSKRNEEVRLDAKRTDSTTKTTKGDGKRAEPKGKGVTTKVKLRGLPYGATTADVVNFFKGFGVLEDSITFGINAEGRPSGEAWVSFNRIEDARKAVREKDRHHMGDRYVELFLLNECGGVASRALK